MITYVMFRDVNLSVLDELARTWERFERKCSELEDEYEQQVIGQLARSDWRGQTADAAMRVLEGHDDVFEVTAMVASGIVTALDQAKSKLKILQNQLHAVVHEALGAGFSVDGRGEVWNPYVTMRASTADASWHDEYPARLGHEIARIVAQTNAIDEEISAVFYRLDPSSFGEVNGPEWRRVRDQVRVAAALAGITEGAIPPDGDPARARAWWAGLTPEQQALYEHAYPERIGALDALPSSARDEANRHALRIAAGDAANVRDTERAQRADNLVKRLEANEYDANARPLYLLGIDNTAAHGRAVVSVGNPDTATHQAVIVPGVNTELDRMSTGEIDRAARLQASADFLAPNPHSVAVIAWLDYDAPGQMRML